MAFTIEQIEKYSSALTLSDMEIFVFPELMYCLTLANLASPVIWQWRQEDCFVKLEGKSPYRKLMRLRQYVMDNFEFNLDLQTWGLTSKETELRRFEKWLSRKQLAESNALFGYEGDKYYFDVDIRKHFGLDAYDGDAIPYWKTETVEAMNAFRLKDGYTTGAGECVSLSSLYAAAAFIVGGVPLDDIYMVLTPLHSQNFIDIDEGIITNNRRLVTKTMWFNGTEISNKAQRALRNERVTIVAHNTGYIHCVYPEATIQPARYRRLREALQAYLTAPLSALNLANFLRSNPQYHRHFQFCRVQRGKKMFIKAEVLFGYEHGSRYRIYEDTFEKLLDEVSSEDYCVYKIPDRICCEQLMQFVQYEKIDIYNAADRHKLARFIAPFVPNAEQWAADLLDFLHIRAKLPDEGQKTFIAAPAIEIAPNWTREQIVEYLISIRERNATADLALYAYRDMTLCDWRPFAKAAIERSPVCAQKAEGLSEQQVYAWLGQMPNISIYDGARLAQPDEVANYNTGDGAEKAFTLAAILARRANWQMPMTLDILPDKAIVHCDGRRYAFASDKNLAAQVKIAPNGEYGWQ